LRQGILPRRRPRHNTVVVASLKLLDVAAKTIGLAFDLAEDLLQGAAWEKHGTFLHRSRDSRPHRKFHCRMLKGQVFEFLKFKARNMLFDYENEKLKT